MPTKHAIISQPMKVVVRSHVNHRIEILLTRPSNALGFIPNSVVAAHRILVPVT